jgi:hypothetical protein
MIQLIRLMIITIFVKNIIKVLLLLLSKVKILDESHVKLSQPCIY